MIARKKSRLALMRHLFDPHSVSTHRFQKSRAIEAQAQEQLSFVRAKIAELEDRLAALMREFSRRSEELTASQRNANLPQLPPPGSGTQLRSLVVC